MRTAKELYAAEPDILGTIDRFVESCAEVNRLCLLGGGTGSELAEVFLRMTNLSMSGQYTEPPFQIESYQSKDFGQLRIVNQDGEPWFIGKDVAKALGYKNTRDALSSHVDEEDKNTVAIYDGIRGNPNTTIINESGLYSLILSSKLEGAKKFKRWVTSEVLPSIRKNGGYGRVPKNYPDALRALADATDKRQPVSRNDDGQTFTFAMTEPADGSEPFYKLVEGEN